MVMLLRFNVLLVALALITVPVQASGLKLFKSDGCTAFPNGTLEQNNLWLSCCQKHDYDYWKGGTYQERLNSDKALEDCVSKVGKPEVALIMLAGVRIGGSPYFPTKFRWGYGWPYPRFYGKHTEQELKQIKKLTSQVNGTLIFPR